MAGERQADDHSRHVAANLAYLRTIKDSFPPLASHAREVLGASQAVGMDEAESGFGQVVFFLRKGGGGGKGKQKGNGRGSDDREAEKIIGNKIKNHPKKKENPCSE